MFLIREKIIQRFSIYYVVIVKNVFKNMLNIYIIKNKCIRQMMRDVAFIFIIYISFLNITEGVTKNVYTILIIVTLFYINIHFVSNCDMEQQE